MKFAYADPPYLGCGARLYGFPEWDRPERHKQLIDDLCRNYPDGWALSLHAKSLQTILSLCPSDVRIGAYCKPFTAGIGKHRVQWMWEPLIWKGGRKPEADEMVRDWVVCWPRSGKKDGIVGGKSRTFSRWLFSLLGAKRGDEFDDIYPGTYAVSAAWAEWTGQPCVMPPLPLERLMA